MGAVSLFLLLFTAACKRDASLQPTGSGTGPASQTSGISIEKNITSRLSSIGFGTTFTLANHIYLNGAANQTISGLNISGGTVPAIFLVNCHNMHITQNQLGNSTDVGICLENCYNIIIDYNYIANVSSGVYAENSPLGGITVNNNQFKNIKGPLPRGQFVQFNNINGPNNNISYNAGENIPGYSNPEDAINLYKSNGTAAYPIKVLGNWIRGGGPSATGGGINLGDNGGSYELAYNNILVNPGQYGIGVSGGSNMQVISNYIYSSAQPFSNVGLLVWAQAGYAISNCTVSYNQVNFTSGNTGQIFENDNWIGPNTPTPIGWNTNIWGANINAGILPTVLTTFIY